MSTRRKPYTPEQRAKTAGFTTEYKENSFFLLLLSEKRFARLDRGQQLIDEADVLFDRLKRQLSSQDIENYQAKRLDAIHIGQEAQDRRGPWPQFIYVYFLNPKLFVKAAQQAHGHITKLAETLSPPTADDVAAADAVERLRYPPPPDPRILDIVDPTGKPHRLGEYKPIPHDPNTAPNPSAIPNSAPGPAQDSGVNNFSPPQPQPPPGPSHNQGSSWRAWDDIPNDMPAFKIGDDVHGRTSELPQLSFTFGQIQRPIASSQAGSVGKLPSVDVQQAV